MLSLVLALMCRKLHIKRFRHSSGLSGDNELQSVQLWFHHTDSWHLVMTSNQYFQEERTCLGLCDKILISVRLKSGMKDGQETTHFAFPQRPDAHLLPEPSM